MTAMADEETIHTLHVRKERQIAAPIDVTFEALLEELGPASEMPGGVAFPMVLEPWPGGRWFRDLGDHAGHLWGHVQVIKPPKLLEISGPLFMSYPVASHVQYRLAAEGGGTHLMLTHRAMGLIPADHREGVHEGWNYSLDRIVSLAERRKSA